MFEACTARRDERFKQFCVLGDLLEEAKGCAANVLVWMLLHIVRLGAATGGKKGY